MKDNILIDKSIDFGARIVKPHRYLAKTKHEAAQLLSAKQSAPRLQR